MSKTLETTIERFDGGFSNDLRSNDKSQYAITKHFDSFTFPYKLVPHRATEADENKNFFLTRFVYAPTDWSASAAPTTYRLFGYGVVSGQISTGKIAIYTYNIDSGIDQAWTVTTNGQAGSGSRDTEVFNYYRGYLYGWTSNTLWRFKTADDTAIDLSFQSITYTTVCQGVHHLSDDILYLFSDNKVHKYDGTTFTAAALTLPNSMKITAACAFGNFLAIGCTTVGNGQKKSTVFLWDRDSSLTTISERHKVSDGTVKHLADLNGKLIAVIDHYTNSTLSLGRPRVFIKQVGYTRSLNEIEMDTIVTGGVSVANFVEDGRLYFPLKAVLNNDTRFGIWVVDENGKATVEFVEEEATSYEGFCKVGGVWFIAHSGDGSCNRSVADASYSTTNSSIYESLKFNSTKPLNLKKLIGVSVFTEPLPTAGQIVLKYRKDEETSWTTIFTHTTDNSMGHSAVNIESSGANFPEHKEIQFQILSTGGAVITGLKFKTEILETEPYE